MVQWRGLGARYAGLSLGVLTFFVVVYHAGMIYLEGRSPAPLHSLQVVVETFTTVGYGSDAPWTNPWMNLLVVVMDLAGVVLVFMALPLLVVPLLEDALATSPPERRTDLSNHVLICEYTVRGETLVDELSTWEREFAVLVPDRETAKELHADGVPVVHCDPETTEGLQAAGVTEADWVVADGTDAANASIALAASRCAQQTGIVATVDDPDNEQYLTFAGADSIVTPRHVLGNSLADKVTRGRGTSFDQVSPVEGDLKIGEIPINENSPLSGSRLDNSGIREEIGVEVIGAWRDGQFEAPVTPETKLTHGMILLATGGRDRLAALQEVAAPGRGSGHVIVAGYGEVGRTVAGALAESDVEVTVIDTDDYPAVDVVGDATDPDTLLAADVSNARAVVLALPDETATAFAALVLEEVAPDSVVVARTDEPEAIETLYAAGADYVLSLARISGRMLAAEVLEGMLLAPTTRVDLVRVDAGDLSGTTLGAADVGAKTGGVVVAIERDDGILTTLGPEVMIEEGDDLIVAGEADAINRLRELTT